MDIRYEYFLILPGTYTLFRPACGILSKKKCKGGDASKEYKLMSMTEIAPAIQIKDIIPRSALFVALVGRHPPFNIVGVLCKRT